MLTALTTPSEYNGPFCVSLDVAPSLNNSCQRVSSRSIGYFNFAKPGEEGLGFSKNVDRQGEIDFEARAKVQ
jgi:hypothetical protein